MKALYTPHLFSVGEETEVSVRLLSMAVGKRFEVYQESDDIRHQARTKAYNLVNMQSSHTVKIYSLKGIRSKSFNTYVAEPSSDQLWSRDLGLFTSSFFSPLSVSLKEQRGLSYQFNPYTIPYSLGGTGSIIIPWPFQHVFLLP